MALIHSPNIVTSNLVELVDVGNQKSYSPNVIPNPTDIFAWCGSAGLNNCTIAQDTAPTPGPSPVGGTALRMTVTGTDPHIGSYNSLPWNLAPAAIGQTWTVSVWVAASVATNGELLLAASNSAGNAFAAGTAIGGAAVNITTGWTRVSFSWTIPGTATSAVSIQCRLDGPTSASPAGIIVWWSGLQVERAAAPTAFNQFPNLQGTNLLDLSTSANNGVINGGPTFDTNTGGSLVFSGSQFVNVANSASLQVGATFSVNCWIFATDLSTRYGVFSTRLANTTGCWQLEVGTATGGTARVAVTGIGTWIWESADNAIALNTWVNICYVRVDNSAPGTLYVNGVALTPILTTAYTILNNSDDKRIGSGTGAAQFFIGRIAVMQLYNVALSAPQVQQNFQALRGRFGI